MKLLKLLATGVVALSISTSSMAAPLRLGLVLEVGGMVVPKIIAVASDILYAIDYVHSGITLGGSSETLRQGRLTNVIAGAGPIPDTSGDGELNEQVWRSQSGFDLTDTDNALTNCAKQSTSRVRYHLASKEDLLALVKSLPTLSDNFDKQARNPFNSGYIPTPAERVTFRADIAAFKQAVNQAGPMLTSNQAGAGTAVTVDANGTVGAVAKDALTPYICVSYFTSRMLEKQSLLSR